MSRKRKGKYTLTEALDILSDATTVQNYPDDGTGVSTDDDKAPGTGIFGEKYKRTSYFNRLTNYQDSWDVDDGDWTWDEFDNCGGMEDERNYSDTLKAMKDLFPKETWENMWKRMKYVSPKAATKGFIDAGQPWRKGGKSQTGSVKNIHMEIDAKPKGSKFKDAKKKNNPIKKIDILTK